MIEGIPRLSVLIITYKQEKLVKRAIDSLLAQKDYIYEICVSDDCSPDKTWDVLQEYDRQYPGLFKLNRNEPNLGIFVNSEKTWTMPTGDIIYTLAGDDEAGEGWFKTVIEYIQKNHIDYKNELFAIYGDYEARYPNGDSFVLHKSIVTCGVDLMRLSTRGLLGNRAACYSINILSKFKKVSRGRSYLPESAMDRQLQFFAKKNYYIPFVGNIYYTQIGVNVHFNNEHLKEREGVEEYARSFFEEQGYHYCPRDLKYIEYQTELAKSYRDKSLKHKLKVAKLFIQSYELSLGLRQLRFKRKLFAILHRLPHKTPISWRV